MHVLPDVQVCAVCMAGTLGKSTWMLGIEPKSSTERISDLNLKPFLQPLDFYSFFVFHAMFLCVTTALVVLERREIRHLLLLPNFWD